MTQSTGDPRATLPEPAVIAISLGAFALAWLVAARLTDDPSILPAPGEVWRIALEEAASGELARHVAATLARVAASFALAMGIGTALGIALGSSPGLDRWLGPWVTVLLNVPALVVIVLCYLWIGLNEVAAITAVAVNKTAMVAVNMREGVRALDPRVAEMARVYRMGPGARLVHVVLPQLAPFVAASTRSGLAIIWKIVLVVEFLGRPDGVGFKIHLYFQLFETGHVLAYAFSFVAVMLALELAVLRGWERRGSAWRRAEG